MFTQEAGRKYSMDYKDIGIREFWSLVKEAIPEGEEVQWGELVRRLGVRGAGIHLQTLRDQGMIQVNFKSYVTITPGKRFSFPQPGRN